MRRISPAIRGLIIFLALVSVFAGWGVYALLHMAPSNVVRVNGKDPKLQAAIKQAKDGLDAFIKELGDPQPDDRFAVKATFQTPFGPEYLWVRKPEFKDGVFSGVLDQQPMAIAGKKKGDSISFAKKDVVDWLIKDDLETRGAFTEKALVK